VPLRAWGHIDRVDFAKNSICKTRQIQQERAAVNTNGRVGISRRAEAGLENRAHGRHSAGGADHGITVTRFWVIPKFAGGSKPDQGRE
jgi:hypothetical protein